MFIRRFIIVLLLLVALTQIQPNLARISELQTGTHQFLYTPNFNGVSLWKATATYHPVVLSSLLFGIFSIHSGTIATFSLRIVNYTQPSIFQYEMVSSGAIGSQILFKVSYALLPSQIIYAQSAAKFVYLLSNFSATPNNATGYLNISTLVSNPLAVIKVVPLLRFNNHNVSAVMQVSLRAEVVNNTMVSITNTVSNHSNCVFRLVIFFMDELLTQSVILKITAFQKTETTKQSGAFNLTESNIFVGLSGLMTPMLVMACSVITTINCSDSGVSTFTIHQFSLATCPPNSSLTLSYLCECHIGTYQNISQCLPCHFSCVACSSQAEHACLSCNTTIKRILTSTSNSSRCLCQTGYVQNLEMGTACYPCMENCLECGNYTTCDVCQPGYSFNSQYRICDSNPRPLFDMKKVKQKLNMMWIQFNFTQPVDVPNIDQVLAILVNNQVSIYQVDKVSPLIIKITLNEEKSNITAVFNSSVKGKQTFLQIDQINSNKTIFLEGTYIYSTEETMILGKLTQSVPLLSNGLAYGRGILVFLGLMVLLADTIEFIQLVTYYLFLEITLPNNLKQLLISLYGTVNAQVLPFELPKIFPEGEKVQFNKPENYETYDVDFEILSGNMDTIIQFLLMFLYFSLFSWLIAKINKQNKLVKWLKNKFVRGIYTNISQLFLSSQIAILFVCCASFRDRQLNHMNKIYNFSAAVIIAFIGAIFVFLHPLILLLTKKLNVHNTQDCYSKTVRESKSSQEYVLASLIVRLAVAIGIPLFPPMAALLSITLSSLIELRLAFKVKFQTKSIKVFRIVYGFLYVLFNVGLMVCVLGEQLPEKTLVLVGYICMGLILINIAREFLELTYDLVLTITNAVKSCVSNAKLEKNKRSTVRPVVHEQLQMNSPDISHVSEQSGQEKRQSGLSKSHKPVKLRSARNIKNKIKFAVNFTSSSAQE